MKKWAGVCAPLLICAMIVAGLPALPAEAAASRQPPAGAVSGRFSPEASDGAAFSQVLPQDARAAVLIGEGRRGAWDFAVPADGDYLLRFAYFVPEGKGADASAEVLLDGKSAFPEMSESIFTRTYTTAFFDDATDRNQRKPEERAADGWALYDLADNTGNYSGAYRFSLKAGTHTLALAVTAESVAVREVWLVPAAPPPDYEEYIRLHEGATDARRGVTAEAERVSLKSDKSIMPVNDRTSPATTPYHHTNVVYNAIGGDSWKMPRQWLEWSLDVPETGFYCLELRCRQSTKLGASVYRTLSIDGEIPFSEAQALAFGYSGGWAVMRAGGREPWRFYLTKGTHTLRLEATPGAYAGAAQKSEALVAELNRLYRQVIMVTGLTPDLNRDYRFERLIPEAIADMGKAAAALREIMAEIRSLSGGEAGSGTSVLQKILLQLEDMHSDPESIPKHFTNSYFANNITALASWVYDLRTQPLALDTVTLAPPESKPGVGDAGFFQNALHYLRQYVSSYFTDYRAVSGAQKSGGKTVGVWVASGRDQAQIIRGLAADKELADAGIAVDLQLVAAGTLLPAVLANTAPDLALMQAQQEPLNFAFRGAVKDLSGFGGYAETAARFHESALVPFTYRGGVYALPETQSFPMLFVRTDILREIGAREADLETWDDVILGLLPKMQKYQLTFGFTMSLNTYLSLLYQRGGALYSGDGKTALLNSPEGVRAFRYFTDIYTDYRQPLAFDFVNRFRSGEMPVAVNDFMAQNQLSVFAPELRGQWSVLPLPGTRRADGSLDRSTAAAVSGAVMLSGCRDPESAWKVLRWWTAAQTQTAYGNELETVMGTAARYNSANLEAFSQLPWPTDFLKNIQAQRVEAKAVPELPGSYYTGRYFDFAVRDVVNAAKDPRETLNRVTKEISAEIKSKHDEFAKYGKK